MNLNVYLNLSPIFTYGVSVVFETDRADNFITEKLAVAIVPFCTDGGLLYSSPIIDTVLVIWSLLFTSSFAPICPISQAKVTAFELSPTITSFRVHLSVVVPFVFFVTSGSTDSLPKKDVPSLYVRPFGKVSVRYTVVFRCVPDVLSVSVYGVTLKFTTRSLASIS